MWMRLSPRLRVPPFYSVLPTLMASQRTLGLSTLGTRLAVSSTSVGACAGSSREKMERRRALPMRMRVSTRQGQADSPALFCIGIHDEVRSFDRSVAAHGGEIRFFMDDGFGSGPPAELFTAFISFVRDLKAATGCRVTSAECYSPDYDLDACPHRRAAAADLDIPIEVAGLHDQAGTFHRGFTVLGAPIGEPGFESMILNTKADKVVGAIDTTVSLLRHVDTAALGALVYCTLQSRYDYWLQHCSTPTAIRPMVVAVDTALLTTLSVSQAAVVPTILDPLILRRIRLPPRRRGLGIRSRVELAPVAWRASFIRAAESFLPGESHHSGIFPNLAGLFGAGAFQEGGHRFATFLANPQSGTADVADAFLEVWSAMQDEAADVPAGQPSLDGRLALPVDRAGEGVNADDSLQHVLCDLLEEAQERRLDRDFRALPSTTVRGKDMPDPRLAAWVECDRISRSFAYDYPSKTYSPSVDEYAEMFASYLGLPSPLAARLGVGRYLHSVRRNLRHPPTLDQWGIALACLFAAGDHWRIQHDGILAIVAGDALRAGLQGSAEVGGLSFLRTA